MSADDFRLHAATAARVLSDLSEEIEQLGTALCIDPAIVGKHLKELQAIDLISQKQRLIARLLEADCPASAVSGIELEQLAQQWRSLANSN